MNMENQYENLSWDLPKNQSNVIKVIGVGGGGSNAINYMYNKGINVRKHQFSKYTQIKFL